MDPFSLIETNSWLGIPVALALGALLGANPAALPMLGTAVGLGSAGAVAARGGAIKVAAAFGAGTVVVYAAVGVVAERIDDLTESLLRPYAGIGYLVLGLLIAGFALFLMLRPSSFCSACALPARKNATMLGAFLAESRQGWSTARLAQESCWALLPRRRAWATRSTAPS